MSPSISFAPTISTSPTECEDSCSGGNDTCIKQGTVTIGECGSCIKQESCAYLGGFGQNAMKVSPTSTNLSLILYDCKNILLNELVSFSLIFFSQRLGTMNVTNRASAVLNLDHLLVTAPVAAG